MKNALFVSLIQQLINKHINKHRRIGVVLLFMFIMCSCSLSAERGLNDYSGINVPLVAVCNVPPVAQCNVPPQKWLQ